MKAFQWRHFHLWTDDQSNYSVRLFSFGVNENERALVHIDFGYGRHNAESNSFANVVIGDGAIIHVGFRLAKADFSIAIWSV